MEKENAMIKTLNKCEMNDVNGGMCVNQALSITNVAIGALGVLGGAICIAILPCLQATHDDPAQFTVAKAKVAFATTAVGLVVSFLSTVVASIGAAYPKCDGDA